MTALGASLTILAASVIGYAFIGYPALLFLLNRGWGRRSGAPSGSAESSAPPDLAQPPDPDSGDDPPRFPGGWPTVSVTVPAYNEEGQIRDTIDSLLAIRYPRDRLQLLVVSDGSTDATERIVGEYEERGVELLRVHGRRGKSAAENTARHQLRGEIVVNTDASVRVRPDAVKKLVARFTDPEVGVASGRDVSVERGGTERNQGEAGYVGYEMWIRDLETGTGGIVGASGCLYAIRREIHDVEVPEHLSRDFMSALNAREKGFRAVSVSDALCIVPRTSSLKAEFRRKIRTIVRGLQTLLYKRHLLNPSRGALFAWKLWSHKIGRWVFPWAGLAGLIGLALLAPSSAWTLVPIAAAGALGLLALAGWLWPPERPVPAAVSVPTYLVSGGIATCVATIRALRGFDASVWEPTRRARDRVSLHAD